MAAPLPLLCCLMLVFSTAFVTAVPHSKVRQNAAVHKALRENSLPTQEVSSRFAKEFLSQHQVSMDKSPALREMQETFTRRLQAAASSQENRQILAALKDLDLKSVCGGDPLCGLDPDAFKNNTELIEAEGYPSEEHTVQTADGFLLRAYRIPAGRYNRDASGTSRPVVFLQHGLLSSSADWVMNYASGSLGFILADAGYDVWMGNSRGNTWSRRHISLNQSDQAFWDWSYDEMAKYDMTAFIDYALRQTNQESLVYVGHSQGTTMAFALLSTNPDYQKKVKLFVALAPVGEITHARSPITLLAGVPDKILLDIFGRKDFLAGDFFTESIADTICQSFLTRGLCLNSLFLLMGPDPGNLNNSRLAVYVHHAAGASTKDMIHFAQVYRAQNFQMFDHGPEGNMQRYNQTTPPSYDVSKVNVPVLAFTAPEDWLADPRDTAPLLAKLPDLRYVIDVRGWNHVDFVWGKDAAHYCYHPMVEWLRKYT